MSTNSRQLNQQAYANEEAVQLRKRIHDLYTIPQMDFQAWVLERFAWRGDEAVLDVGSGPGTYLSVIQEYLPLQQVVSYDLSHRMLQAARDEVTPDAPLLLLQGDAARLPFPDASFDVVMANHLLHLLEDIDGVVKEFRRVLRPKGVLIAATNSEYTMPEFNTLMQRAFRLLGRAPEREESIEQMFLHNFSLETGPVKLARVFQAVARHDVPSALVFTETEPVLDYINSARAFYEPYMPAGIIWEDFMRVMGDQVKRLIDHFGELAVNKVSGVVMATDSGGFASDYYARLQAE